MSIINEIVDSIEPDCGIPVPSEEISSLPFSQAIWPWMKTARRRLKKTANPQLYLLSSEARASLELSLMKRWSLICTPTLFFEMELKRSEFSLEGNTPRERYLDFIQKAFLDKKALGSFYEEYRELARLIALSLVQWVEQIAEILLRLEKDLPLLEKTFNEGRPLGKISRLEQGMGDMHHGGRSVSLLTFTSKKSLFYKPKELGISEAFSSFINELNDLGLSPSLKTYRILSRDDYGWEEPVNQKPCKNLAEVRRYYERAGMLLCIFYILEGKDLHYGNVVASGEYPVLIDVEMLFQSNILVYTNEARERSVLSVGLLPAFCFEKIGEEGIDISGLGLKEEVVSMLPEWENINTDLMTPVYKKKALSTSHQQVIYNGEVMSAEDNVEAIISGFRTMYRFIQEKRKESWITLMAACNVRILIRPTRFYSRLLERLWTPHIILNKNLQEEELAILSDHLGRGGERLSPIAEEEKKALLEGDIPCFYTLPSSRDLFVKNKLIVKNCLEKPALENILISLQQMSDSNLHLQELLIRQACHVKTSQMTGV